MSSTSSMSERLEKIDGLLDIIDAEEAALDRLLGFAEKPPLVSVLPPPIAAPSPPATEGELAAHVAKKIVAERRSRGWRQLDLAAATGIARPNIARIESGRRMPKISTIQRIARALEISLEKMMS